MSNVFYTCVTGPDNGYVHDVSDMDHCGFDFVTIHDSHHGEFPGWRSINIDAVYPFDKDMHGHKQRYAKTMPHLFLEGYDYSVYLDPKWELTENFLNLCRQRIDENPSWLVCAHPSRSTLFEEFLFPFSNGILSYEECVRVVDALVEEKVDFEKYFASLNTWIIRQHNHSNAKIGKRWFDLIHKCYDNHVRDQILLPFAIESLDQVNRCLSIEQLYRAGVRLNYPNQNRIRKVDWQKQIYDLIAYLHSRTGLLPNQQVPRTLRNS
ncbi:MAG TPA: hypothetical protein DCM64_10160 [Gammaproteobacteria bacterium]|jgi:hypothetical protein|nr:hypothetical protein [Gammaproteobacteria bacterium]MDP6731663.1 hypothetical protein [Gammaproteobacteria bacterium]HAJ76806.1 hypothetical protein [Gammaproteobacteria bacterium]|tara:strand:+ start:1604 stop:2398 length:795 start_codon:yes stop_codon:yes gene_type:complete